jgi:hypothetical protein
VAFARVLVAFAGAALAGDLALGAVLVPGGVLGAFRRAGAADVGAQGAVVAVVGRAAREDLEGGLADVGAIEIGAQPFMPSRMSAAAQAWQARRAAAQASIQCWMLAISESAMVSSFVDG